MADVRVLIQDVIDDSPAYEAGFEPGCYLTSLEGQPITDILDWRWRSDGDLIEVGYVDLDGEAGTVVLEREQGEDWGFVFDDVIFDGVRTCRNRCTFCFMAQLPRGMRDALYVRDDDFRLSFLSGTFVTLTNLGPEDEQRIVEQRLSPLHVSLQAVDADVRERIIGPNAALGLAALERLMSHGIECHAQIVLLPDENDGIALERTLQWAQSHPQVLSVGIVPVGFTRHQSRFKRSFDDARSARAVLATIAPFQEKAIAAGKGPWVYAADEFYLSAYGNEVLSHIPEAAFYGDFSMFEDGIGIVRTVADQWAMPEVRSAAQQVAATLKAAGRRAHLISGRAQQGFLGLLMDEAGLQGLVAPFYVTNHYFGGNVDVTGLLTARDIAEALRRAALPERDLVLVPSIIFNDDGLTLDGVDADGLSQEAGRSVAVVSLEPGEYLEELIRLVEAKG